MKACGITAVPMPAIGTDRGVHLIVLMMMTGLIAVRNEPRLRGPIIAELHSGPKGRRSESHTHRKFAEI